MNRGAARHNDLVKGNCAIHGRNIIGRIITASSDVITNGRGQARIGDKVLAECGHEAMIITGSSKEFANGRSVARQNDLVGNSPYEGKILTGSSDTFPEG
jgi:uncharacterized Zn-binding protein involved in type VI secretion